MLRENALFKGNIICFMAIVRFGYYKYTYIYI